jgi:acyl-coenzyme A thioesterase 13
MDLSDLTQFLANPRHDGWRVHGLEAVSADPGRIVMRLEVGSALLNYGKTLHGGAAATLIDVVGSIAIVGADRHGRFGVSTDLNVTWIAPAALGEIVLIEATVLKIGRNLGFVAVELRRESDGALLVQGRLSKALGDPPAHDG